MQVLARKSSHGARHTEDSEGGSPRVRVWRKDFLCAPRVGFLHGILVVFLVFLLQNRSFSSQEISGDFRRINVVFSSSCKEVVYSVVL